MHALPVMELKGQPLPPDLITCSFSKPLRMLQEEKKVQQILFRHAGAVTLHMCAL